MGSGSANGQIAKGRAQKGSVLVTGKFVGSLGSLMAAIAETEPHYIRCVKPNEEQLPMSFQASLVSLFLFVCCFVVGVGVEVVVVVFVLVVLVWLKISVSL